jgi:ATP-binding protein involved in chromosome partitioning
MTVSRDDVLDTLRGVEIADGGDLVSRDLVRALIVDGDSVRFVVEAADAESARALEPVRAAAEAAVAALDGVSKVTAVLTAPAGPAKSPPATKTLPQNALALVIILDAGDTLVAL